MCVTVLKWAAMQWIAEQDVSRLIRTLHHRINIKVQTSLGFSILLAACQLTICHTLRTNTV